MKDYGYKRTSDPDYWLKNSQAIWGDPALTHDEKMNAQGELVQEYQKEKRDKSAREAIKKGGFVGEKSKEVVKHEEYYDKTVYKDKKKP